MMVYQQRIKYFGNDKKYPEGYIYGLMGIDLLRYKKGAVDDIYKYLSKSVDLQKNKTAPAVITTFMQISSRLYQLDKMKADDVVNNFIMSMDILDYQRNSAQRKVNLDQYYQYLEELDSLENHLMVLNEDKTTNKLEIRTTTKNISKYKKVHKTEFNLDQCGRAVRNIEIIFSNSGTASCENLVDIFTPKFAEQGSDIDFLKKVTQILDKNVCDDTKLFADASEQLYKLEPSPLAAYNIAKLYVKKGTDDDFAKAAEYYENAIMDETDDLAKAKYFYELAYVRLKLGAYSEVRRNANEAIKRNRSWGNPYLLIAMAYAATSKSCGADDFEQKAVYWAAVDKCKKAKSVDKTIAEQAQQLIKSYAGQFPNNEEAFFRNLTNGKSYKVGCWINENTIVRTVKR